jgi:hypothetical protein
MLSNDLFVPVCNSFEINSFFQNKKGSNENQSEETENFVKVRRDSSTDSAFSSGSGRSPVSIFDYFSLSPMLPNVNQYRSRLLQEFLKNTDGILIGTLEETR